MSLPLFSKKKVKRRFIEGKGFDLSHQYSFDLKVWITQKIVGTKLIDIS